MDDLANTPAPEGITRRARPSKAADHAPADDVSDDQTYRFVIEAARLLRDRHCENIIALDVRGLSNLTDYILIATGTSDRQMKAVGHELEDLAKLHHLARIGREIDGSSTWLALDFVDVIAHLFEPATRTHYDLEMMWGDAKPIHWDRV